MLRVHFPLTRVMGTRPTKFGLAVGMELTGVNLTASLQEERVSGGAGWEIGLQ